MATHIVLLRAINVGGHNKIAMADLRDVLEQAGFGNVNTYIQSGNIVCSSRKGANSVAREVKKLVAGHFGHDIEVIVRSPGELSALHGGYPWGEPDPKASGIVFLAGPPAADLDAAAFLPDQCLVAGSDVYVNYAESFSQSKLTPAWIEKAAGQPGTRRNWNTINKLLSMTHKL